MILNLGCFGVFRCVCVDDSLGITGMYVMYALVIRHRHICWCWYFYSSCSLI